MNGYTLKKTESGRIMLCKILNIYTEDEEKQANGDLIDLVVGHIKEEDMLATLRKKDVTR